MTPDVPSEHLQQTTPPVAVAVDPQPLPRVYIYVHGILSNAADSRVWDHRAVTWTNKFTRHKGDNLPYICGPITRAFHQQARIDNLVLLLREYEGCELVLAAHSNGCAIVLKALADADYPRIRHLHLFNAACQADFQANGLNGALRRGAIGQVSVYMAGQDRALRLVSWFRLARLLGYGTLGLVGPQNVAPEARRLTTDVKTGVWKGYGHSSCWSVYNFDDTMGLITA